MDLGMFQTSFNFEKWKINLRSPGIHHKFMVPFLNELWHICIASKVWNIKKLFWFADIWHRIHVFYLLVKCAWWVISKWAHVFRSMMMYNFYGAASEFSHVLYLKHWICTDSKFCPFPQKWLYRCTLFWTHICVTQDE